jgi:uncharacterized protein
MTATLSQKLNPSNTPKKILSLDGGGVRGILTLGILKQIETLAREKKNNPNLVLGDYYDLIGGTSTGAIIASGLATGKTVDEIIALYQKLGKEIFGQGRKKKWLCRDWKKIRALLNENYDSKKLENYLKEVFGETTIGDNQKLKCGLAINTKRADTYSLWTVANHPDGKYFEANKHLKLWELCRASSAAPYYFKPKKLGLKTRTGTKFDATFIDGGVSLANNPAWQTFLEATVPSFGFHWKSGKDQIQITSLGTGNGITKEDPEKLVKAMGIAWAPKLSDLFMVDALEMNQIIMDAFGYNAGDKVKIDSQFDDLNSLNFINDNQKLFTFVRHNVTLTAEALEQFAIKANNCQIESLKEMDHFENMDLLLEIGEKYAQSNCKSIL